MPEAGLLTIGFLCIQLVIVLIMKLLGLAPEQRAARRNRSMMREAERAARAADGESRLQHQRWHEEVERQRVKGRSRFTNEAEARAALQGRGGRASNLDDRWFP